MHVALAIEVRPDKVPRSSNLLLYLLSDTRLASKKTGVDYASRDIRHPEVESSSSLCLTQMMIWRSSTKLTAFWTASSNVKSIPTSGVNVTEC